jgi:hypothetical protein
MNFDTVHNNKDLLLLQCISGSKAYGLDTPQSDIDIKGVFILPKKEFYGLDTPEQVADTNNDTVYYELRRFIELLLKNNPNILELLSTPDDCILYRHSLMFKIKPEYFLSRLCLQTFAGYAQTQIKKASGLNKKIFNPIDTEKKSILDFCHIIVEGSSVPLVLWLEKNNLKQEDCGLTKVHNARDVFAVYKDPQSASFKPKGISSGPDANDVSLTSIPDGLKSVAILSFNKDGYSSYCRDYKEYWQWMELRNEQRFRNVLEQGKNYDPKNMMHTFRLLNIAEEIATERKINVRRNDRDFLFKIRNGAFSYDELLQMANEKLERMESLYETSDLPPLPDSKMAEQLLYELRNDLYA